jgi:hypothetical protein
MQDRSGDITAAIPLSSWQRSQRDRAPVNPSNHLHVISPVSSILFTDWKSKQPAQLVYHKENVLKTKETPGNMEDFYCKKLTKKHKFLSEETEKEFPSHIVSSDEIDYCSERP